MQSTQSRAFWSSIVMTLTLIALGVGWCDSVEVIPKIAPIVVDGNTNDIGWQVQTALELSYPEDYMLGRAENSSGFGMKFKLGHGESNLYFQAEVIDDALSLNPWPDWTKGDAVCLGWSLDPQRHLTPNMSDRLIIIKPQASDSLRVIRLATNEEISCGSSVVSFCSGGWSVECSIPLSEIGAPSSDAVVGLVVLQWDVDPGIFGPNVLGSFQNAPMIAAGPVAFGAARFSIREVYSKSVEGKDLKREPDNVPLSLNRLGWTVTKKSADSLYCQDPYGRIYGIKVSSPLADSVLEGNLIWGLTGTLIKVDGERVLVASNIDWLSGVGYPMPAPFGLNSSSLGGLNSALLVRVAGKVTQVGDGFFLLSDGAGQIRVESDTFCVVGSTVIVSGVASLIDSSPAIYAKEVLVQ